MKKINRIPETTERPEKNRKHASHPYFGKMKLLATIPRHAAKALPKNTKENTFAPSL